MALISETMIPAMDEVGKLFYEEEFFVPELMLAGRAMKAAMEPLRPLLAAAGAKPVGVVVAGAVKGDLHDNRQEPRHLDAGRGELQGDRPRGRRLAGQVHRGDPRAPAANRLPVGASYHDYDGDRRIASAGLRREVKILVGGAPITERYAMAIGADGYGATATEAVALARRQVGISN